VLQLSQNADVASLPADARQKLFSLPEAPK
jgi:hypothetical protein